MCLNQRDEAEKASQVPLMGAIYQAARRVHIWLGDDRADDARRAFALLRRVDLGADGVEESEEAGECLAALFRRTWFARRWTVQEAVLAHDAVVHCGEHSIGLSWVVSALRKVQNGGGGDLSLAGLGYGAEMLLSSVATFQADPMSLSLLKFLWDLHRSECSDKRDRIAAVYGLAARESRPAILRYNDGFETMCLDTATYFINKGASSAHEMLLHLVDFGGFASRENAKHGLPSWVPDWSRTRRQLVRYMFQDQQAILRRQPGRGSYLRRNEWISTTADEYRDLSSLKKLRLAWMNYCRGFGHPTRMSASAHSLRVESHPKVFALFGGVVEKVYTFPSEWRELASSLFERGDFGSRTHNLLYTASTLLDTFARNMDGKSAVHNESPIRDALDESRQDISEFGELSPAAKDGLKKLMMVLSQFSLVRSRRNWHESLSELALAPRGVAVGDLMVPLVVHDHEDDQEGVAFSGFRELSVLLCLRPDTAHHHRESLLPPECVDLRKPFRRTVRWQGLAALDRRRDDGLRASLGNQASQHVFRAFCRSLDQELPGPYVFDVI